MKRSKPWGSRKKRRRWKMMTGGPWKRVRIAHKIVGKMRRVKMAC
jgi:hypothetical protein